MRDTRFIMPGGALITNFFTLGAVANYTFTVPARKRWWILAGRAERDQNTTFQVHFRDPANNIIMMPVNVGAGVTDCCWVPGGTVYDRPTTMVLDAGYDVYYLWGAAQTSPEVSLIVLELDVGS